ncbi:MAG TPA: hypothetical protein VFI68_13225 [Anaerolineales bacterium]|nr:hypothetical protein [Anaerolineales bacterium]
MNTWFLKKLGDGMMGSMAFAEIEEIFLPQFESAGRPINMAVFTKYKSEGRLHCEITAYFSPAASNAARLLGAEPCRKPSRVELGLLFGDKNSWSELFPELAG